jgi:FtsZ-binding cell division protein ZapB
LEEKETVMIKLYAMIVVLAVLGMVGAGAVWYYNDTQARIATLRENNAKLEVAVQTAEESINTLQETMAQVAEANNKLQKELQKAEAYGDELQSKLRRHNLTALALKKPALLEGKMNGATANLWRDLEKDSGGDGTTPLPEWLLSSTLGEQTRSEDGSSNQGGTSTDSDSSTSETSTTN